jgi:TonB family protein
MSPTFQRINRFFALMGIAAMVVLAGSAIVAAQAGFVAAWYVSGELPAAPAMAVSGGEVFLEVLVAPDGHVDSIRTLRTTPPFTDVVIAAVRGWWFEPATDAAAPSAAPTASLINPVAAPVFVAAIFAPPDLNGPTLGQPPKDVLSASDDAPMPAAAIPAAYPPLAVGGGAVLVEVMINGTGVVTGARVKASSPAFDAAALAAARAWSFRPARRHGNAVTTHAYLMFVFRQPIT